jgi:hypothetical protein
VPVAPVVGGVTRHHHLVTEPGRDLVVAPRAPVHLHRLVRVHVTDLDRTVGNFGAMRGHGAVAQPNTAQSTSAATTTSAAATITTSLVRLVCERNGLSPIPLR